MKQFAKTLSIGAASLSLGLVCVRPMGYIPTTSITAAQSVTNAHTPLSLGSNSSLVSNGFIIGWLIGKALKGVTGWAWSGLKDFMSSLTGNGKVASFAVTTLLIWTLIFTMSNMVGHMRTKNQLSSMLADTPGISKHLIDSHIPRTTSLLDKTHDTM